jgi:hypothetical protein
MKWDECTLLCTQFMKKLEHIHKKQHLRFHSL